MWMTENIVHYFTQETIQNHKLKANKILVTLSEKKDTDDMYITLEYNGKKYWSIFHYWRIGYDKNVCVSKLKSLWILKKNITYK